MKGKIVYLFFGLALAILPFAFADQYLIIAGKNCVMDSDNSCTIQNSPVPEFHDAYVVTSSSSTFTRVDPHPDTWNFDIPEFHDAVVIFSSKT